MLKGQQNPSRSKLVIDPKPGRLTLLKKLQRNARGSGADEGTRTLNLRITNPPLCQLSYASLESEREGLYGPSGSPASLCAGALGALRVTFHSGPIWGSDATRRRNSSYRITAPAADTLSESTLPIMGMDRA